MAISDNLVGWWSPSLDDAGDGTTTLTDLSGNSNDGTLTNMDPATDWVADTDNGGVRALDFDGSQEHVNCGSALSLTTSFSVSCWCKADPFTGTHTIAGIDDAETQRGWNLNRHQSAGKWRFLLSNNGSSTILRETASDAISGSWQNIVAVYDSDALTMDIYVNSLLDNGGLVGTIPSSVFDSSSDFTIGALAGSASPWNGSIDSLLLFDRALSASEVAVIYDGGRSFDLLSAVEITPNIFNGGPLHNPIFSGGIIQ